MKIIEILWKFVDLFSNKRFKNFFWIVFPLVVGFSIYGIAFLKYDQLQKNRIPRLKNECKIQAKKIFDKIQSANRTIIYSFEEHYNDYLGDCFIILHGEGINNTGKSDQLINAFTEEIIADCESHTDAPEIDFCKFNGAQSHYSIKNFYDFITVYLEDK